MERKRMALACLSIILLTSLALIVPTRASNGGGQENSRYIVMGGKVTTCTQTGIFPKVWTDATFTPMLISQNITFGDPHPVTGVINLTVPAASYVGIERIWYDETSGYWYKLSIWMAEDGYGWLFTGNGSAPILGDVDLITFSNNTGVYSFGPDGLHSETPDATWTDDFLAGPPPAGLGADGIPGTGDPGDAYGDGAADPVGSSVLYLPTTLTVDFWTGTAWTRLVKVPWPQVMTTATAYDVVIETASLINGANSTEEGEPWEFLAGLQEQGPVPYSHSKWNAFVTYVCSWAMLETNTTLRYMDVFYEIKEKKVREDCVIADIDSNEICDIFDIVKIGVAYGAKDEGPGPDGTPGTPDDKPEADPNWNAQADLKDERGEIDIFDLVRCAIDYGAKLTPDCIIRP